MALSLPSGCLATFPIPRVASALLGHRQDHSSGFSAEGQHSHCWAIAGGQLLLWQYAEGVDARLTVLRLPPGVHAKHAHCQVLTQPTNQTSPSVIICTRAGLLIAWLNVSHLAEPLTHQVPLNARGQGGTAPAVAAFVAVSPSGPSGGGLVAVLAGTDGSLFTVQVSPQGMHSQQLFAGVPAAADPGGRGMLGALGQVTVAHGMAWYCLKRLADLLAFPVTVFANNPLNDSIL